MLFLLSGIFEDKFATITFQFVHVFYVFPSAIVCSKTLLAYWTLDFAKSFKTKKRVSVVLYRLTDYIIKIAETLMPCKTERRIFKTKE